LGRRDGIFVGVCFVEWSNSQVILMACGLNFTSQPIINEGKDGLVTLNGSVHIKGMYDEVIHHVKLSRNLLATCGDQINYGMYVRVSRPLLLN
jgi:hypothetical protein